ncbi:MAG: hypothetical protein ACYTHK_02775 [Planctomycetota bacterium]|jgi:hypothetical protein
MTRAKDPFEEFLRKKKVEMLEDQYRKDEEPHPEMGEEELFEDGWTPPAPGDEDLDRDEKLEQEMNEFFEQGGRGGAELFERAKEIDEERVEEIRDALDDVFEEPAAEPTDVVGANDTFVDFFKQVQHDFEPEAKEAVQPDESGPFEDEPLTADFPVPGEDTDTEIAPLDLQANPPTFPAVGGGESETGLAIADVLTPPQEGEDLLQRVDLLSRLVVKLVERSKLPESEIIEVLIKSGVEF